MSIIRSTGSELQYCERSELLQNLIECATNNLNALQNSSFSGDNNLKILQIHAIFIIIED